MEKTIDRKSLAKKTSVINLMARIITMIIQFVTRSIFLQYLGLEYLGLNSTLAQLVGTLSVSELGMQAVIIYKLYKPLVEDDKEKINEIMSVYRDLYRYVFLFISIGSIILIPFLNILITNVNIPFNEIVLSWILMAETTAVSYLLSYNYALVTASQRLYIITCAESIIRVVFGGIGIVILIFVHDYFCYLIVNMASTIIINISYLIIRKKYYPWLSLKKAKKGLYKDIIIMVKDGFAGKISSYIFNSTDSIIISAMISTVLVGVFGNYSTLVASITLIMSSLINPVQAIIGNYLVKANEEQKSDFVFKYSYIVYLICSILFIPTFLLINDFVCLFYGFNYQIDYIIIFLLAVDKYIGFALISVCSMLDAAGKFKIQKRMYFIGAIINIIISLIGVKVIGLPGVIIGTIIGHLYYWYTGCRNCYKEVIGGSGNEIRKYVNYNIVLIALYIGISVALFFVFNAINMNISVLSFIVKGFVSVTVIVLVHFIVFRKTTEFKYMIEILGIKRMTKVKFFNK